MFFLNYFFLEQAISMAQIGCRTGWLCGFAKTKDHQGLINISFFVIYLGLSQGKDFEWDWVLG